MEIIKQHHVIDQVFATAFGIEGATTDELIRESGVHPNELPAGAPPAPDGFKDAFLTSVEDLIDEAVQEAGASRSLTKKTYVADRQIELLANRFGVHPEVVIHCRRRGHLHTGAQTKLGAEDIISFLLGSSFGRWDIRYATGAKAAPELPDPFAPLPVCPPGQLQNAQGLPLTKEEFDAQFAVNSGPSTPNPQPSTKHPYPLRITWSGILVDDPNHPEDIECRVREAIEVIWPDPTPVIESETCEILSVKSLRDYFRKSFFPDHLSRYSKSRRQAPIYWPLSTPSATYTIWLYYHRFTKDTFYRVQEIATEKLAYEERKLTGLHQDFGPEPAAGQRKQLGDQESFVQELCSFREEIARVAALWNPDLNDGVIINFAPLWRLVAYRPWQKALKTCWDSLVAAEYDWSHLALHLWPERVVPKCQTDRSLAIAHGLDAVFWEEDEDGKPKPKKVTKPELQKLIAERTSPAVKEALQSLLATPVAGGARKKARK